MARTDGVWEIIDGVVRPIGPDGYDILAYGTNRYFNFNILYGSTGYGIRDNSGVMQFKNSGGSWADIGSGGGGGGIESVVAGTNISVDNTDPLNPIVSSLSDRYKTTSTTSQAIVSTGTLAFTVGADLTYTPQQDVIIAYDSSNHMHGSVVSYSGTTLVVDIQHKTGSGTYTSWVINLDAINAPQTFTSLTDAPASYTGEAGKIVAVNGTEDGLEFITPSSGGTPGGADTSIQYNNGGAFGGFGYVDSTNNLVSIYDDGVTPTPRSRFGVLDLGVGLGFDVGYQADLGDSISIFDQEIMLMRGKGGGYFDGNFTTLTQKVAGSTTWSEANETLDRVFVGHDGDGSGTGNGKIRTYDISAVLVNTLDETGIESTTLSTLVTAPTTNGTTKMVITDEDGHLSYDSNDYAPLSGATFTGNIIAPILEVDDDTYGVGRDGNLEVPTKNAIYDKIETLSGGGGGSSTPYEMSRQTRYLPL